MLLNNIFFTEDITITLCSYLKNINYNNNKPKNAVNRYIYNINYKLQIKYNLIYIIYNICNSMQAYILDMY